MEKSFQVSSNTFIRFITTLHDKVWINTILISLKQQFEAETHHNNDALAPIKCSTASKEADCEDGNAKSNEAIAHELDRLGRCGCSCEKIEQMSLVRVHQ